MSQMGISGGGRAELAAVAGRTRFITPAHTACELDVSAQVAARKLANWAEKGWLRRVRRGLYIAVPVEAEQPERWSQDPLLVADAVWSPCYFTGWTAAGHWGLTDQVFRTTVLKTSRRVRVSRVRLLDSDFLLAHIPERAIGWGVERTWREDTRLLLADPARTVIDILDAPHLGGGIRHAAEILDAYLDEHEPDPLVSYGELLGNRAVFKRLGFLLQALGRDQPRLIAACEQRLSAGVTTLDPDGPAGGKILTRWRIRVNASVTPTEAS